MTSNPLEPLIDLYSQMDTTWDKIASEYHFLCSGCKDSCCQSLFFHHTYIERTYFLHGFSKLSQDKKEIILDRAKTYCQTTFTKNSEIKTLKIMCPVNENGNCSLYSYRPMICRLHGLPHELRKPGHPPVKGKGCDTGQFEGKPYLKFDRTLYYQKMAQIETQFRYSSNKKGKIKETIAQILISQ